MSEHRQVRRTRLIAVGVLAISLGVTAAIVWHWSRHNAAVTQVRFAEAAEHVADLVVARVQIFEYGLRGARGAMLTMAEPTRRDLFRVYGRSRQLDREFTGARGFGFIRRVRAEDEAAFVETARRDGKPDFAVRQLSPHAGERYVIQYIEPAERNLPAIGLDIAVCAGFREAWRA